ncbi:MAG: molybdopterin-guanine dinucleotide biosynthesis protein B [Promethearchaeota archaeon]
MIYIRIIDVIGYSGSGKTNFIINAIRLFKEYLNYDVVVIKNVKHHQVDMENKDSYKFFKAGAKYSVIGNQNREIALFLKLDDKFIDEIINWLQKGPHKIDICLTEGFRNLNNPTVLCTKKLEDIDKQFNGNIKMISGIICILNIKVKNIGNVPIVDIEKDFQKFLKIFNIK